MRIKKCPSQRNLELMFSDVEVPAFKKKKKGIEKSLKDHTG